MFIKPFDFTVVNLYVVVRFATSVQYIVFLVVFGVKNFTILAFLLLIYFYAQKTGIFFKIESTGS